ncbi:MAG: CehA/McbA family metallohydrolase [Deltaproteobacteria bacterium]|nr:CehA/McbA family metallohydrolase [Deltaproteobacteria bacterium]
MRFRRVALTPCLLLACTSDAPSGSPRLAPISRVEDAVRGREEAGRVGDFLLTNDEVRFVVQAASSGTGFSTFGGSLVDAVVAGSQDDRLQEIFAQCDLRAIAPTKAEIIDDGRSGAPAVLRLTGPDRGIPLLDTILKTQPLDLEMSVDYVLPPSGRTLEIIVRGRDVKLSGSRELQCGLVVIPGDSLDGFVEGEGWEVGAADSEIPYFAAASPASDTSFVLYRMTGERKTGELSPISALAEVVPLTTETRTLVTGGTREERFFVSLGSGDVESAIAEMRRIMPSTSEVRHDVELELSRPSPMEGERFRVTVDDLGLPEGNRSATSVSIDGGGGRVSLPPGHYSATVQVGDRASSSVEFDVPVASKVRLDTPELGLIRVTPELLGLDGGSMGATAGLVTLFAGHGARVTGPRLLRLYVQPEEEFSVPAGEYTIVVSHGPECDLWVSDVTVESDEVANVAPVLRTVVDSRGWVAGDFHVHGSKSLDADADRRLRVLGAVAEGLDLLVSTDHDIVTDYRPLLERVGLDAKLTTATGMEASPLWGHINSFPLVAESPPRYFAIPWFKYSAEGVYGGMLEPHELTEKLYGSGAEIVQINHPRFQQGVFDYLRLDPRTGRSEKTWPRADAFEVLNGKLFDEFDALFTDMVALRKAGVRMTATGVSDAHGAYSGIGYARTFTKAPDTQPIELSPVWQGLREGRVVASTGPFVSFSAKAGSSSAEVGEVLRASGPVKLDVEVQAPGWLALDRVEIFQEGQLIATRSVESVDTATVAIPAVRFRHTFTATASADTFFIAVVRSDRPSLPVIDDLTIAVTNPIDVDVP